MDTDAGTLLLTSIFLFLGNAFFVAAEYSIVSSRRSSMEALAKIFFAAGAISVLPATYRFIELTNPSDLEMLEGLEQLRFLAAGIPVAVVDVATPPFALRELNNPEDVEPIEQALAEAGLE